MKGLLVSYPIFIVVTYVNVCCCLDGQYPGSNEAEMMRQMSLSDGYPSEQHGSGLPNNQGYTNNPPMMNKEYQT